MRLPDAIERVLALSRADACIVIGREDTTANARWAGNTVTTNGAVADWSVSVVSILGRRVASATRTALSAEDLEPLVRRSEAACARTPEAADYQPLLPGNGAAPDWDMPAESLGIHVLDGVVPKLGAMFRRARVEGIQTFGYAEHTTSTVWLATSTGLRRRHTDGIGKLEFTAKTPDFGRSAWTGRAAATFDAIDPERLFDELARRLDWSGRSIALPPGEYEVLLEPSCTADLAVAAYSCMSRRDADEGRSPFSRPGGGTRIGERLFGEATLYADPADRDLPTVPFQVSSSSSPLWSVFDNGLPAHRTTWVGDGTLEALIAPRYWAANVDTPPVPYIDNLMVGGGGATLDEMIASTTRGLLVTCLWYMRTVDPQTALMTGLTRDGVFLVEDGQVRGAVNNFRWNMSPIAAFANATEFGRAGTALPREYDDFLRVKAPPMRVARFNMSSVSDAV
jgi:predicted Zn-dependent protease